jgi:prepilin-type N-terminal cleavage/methylation domain-containing protein
MRRGYKFISPANTREAGFTLIEIILALVVIGVTVPSLMIWFSGLENSKNPEYVVQGSFIAQKKMEELASRYRTSSNASKAIITVCPNALAATTTDGDYSIDCQSTDVNATTPNTSATSTFAKKITLTVTRTDGAMAALVFNTLFTMDS